MAKDLRDFLGRLKKEHPQGLIIIGEERGTLDPNECECTGLLLRLARMNRWPTAVFENVSTLSGERWPGRMIFSEFGSWPNIAIMLDLDPNRARVSEILDVLRERGKNRDPGRSFGGRMRPLKS